MRWLLATAGIATLLAGCADPRAGRVNEDANEYVRAVQYHDTAGLIKRMAAFRAELAAAPEEAWEDLRARFIGRAESGLASYEGAKSTGILPLEPDGIDLLLALAIGKGNFYRFTGVQLEDDGAAAVGRMEVVLDYAERRFAGLPAGTRVYLMTDPFGTLRTVTLGAGEEQELRAVGRVQLEWRFRWFAAVDVYPEGWAIESVRALPDTVEWTELRRVF